MPPQSLAHRRKRFLHCRAILGAGEIDRGLVLEGCHGSGSGTRLMDRPLSLWERVRERGFNASIRQATLTLAFSQ